jgi:hypothetical protein
LLGRRSPFKPGEKIVKFKQTCREEKQDQLSGEPYKRRKLQSSFTFPSEKHMPKNLYTKIVKSEQTPFENAASGKKVNMQ